MRPLSRLPPRSPVLACATLLLALSACRTGARLTDDPGGTGAPGNTGTTAGGGGGGGSGNMVSLSAADLAPVDQWISAKHNPQWIVGDDVEVIASREYFATALTVNTPAIRMVERRDEATPQETVVRVRFKGARSQAGVSTSPRVQIGTGLTVSARRSLVVRLTKTVDPDNPVRLQISARGEAARGVREQVAERASLITTSGMLRRRGGGYSWDVTPRR